MLLPLGATWAQGLLYRQLEGFGKRMARRVQRVLVAAAQVARRVCTSISSRKATVRNACSQMMRSLTSLT